MAEVDETLKNLLSQIAKEQNYANHNLKIESISSGGANYTSHLYNVTYEEGNNTHHMFVKVAAMGEKVRSQMPNLYKTENFVYTKLTKIYKALEDEHEINDKHRLKLSKFYGSIPTIYKEIIVLENLVMKGYQAYDRFKSIDWEYAVSAMTELSKLHALSFAYSIYHTEEFNTVLDNLKFEWNMKEGHLSDYFDITTTRAIEMIQGKNKDKLKKFFETFGKEKLKNLFKGCLRPVLKHGDFRPSNLMHRIRHDGTVDIKIVDLQTLQGSSPVVDLLYFIFTGSDEQFRAQYYEKLVDHYYTELEAAMKRLHLDPEKVYSRADFEQELKEKLPFGLTIAVFALPVITVDVENAPKVNEDMELSSFSVDKTSDLYVERLNGIVNDFVKWGILK